MFFEKLYQKIESKNNSGMIYMFLQTIFFTIGNSIAKISTLNSF